MHDTTAVKSYRSIHLGTANFKSVQKFYKNLFFCHLPILVFWMHLNIVNTEKSQSTAVKNCKVNKITRKNLPHAQQNTV